MNELKSCMCIVLAIELLLPVVMRSDAPKELLLVARIVLCVAEVLLAGFAVVIMQ